MQALHFFNCRVGLEKHWLGRIKSTWILPLRINEMIDILFKAESRILRLDSV